MHNVSAPPRTRGARTMNISKSSYMQLRQCRKLFWLARHRKAAGEADETSPRMEQGRRVEELARDLFPAGVAVNHEQAFSGVMADSNNALRDATSDRPIFQAVVHAEGLLAEVDILMPRKKGVFDIYEVKSSTEVKDEHLHDVAFQRHVCIAAGLDVRKCFVVHVDSGYVRNGDVDPEKLFKIVDVTPLVVPLAAEVEANIRAADRIVAAKTPPDIDIGPHCSDPQPCPFADECWGHVHKEPKNIFTLSRLGQKAWPLYRGGVIRSADIPVSFKLSDKQRLQLRAEKTGRPHFGAAEIASFLARLERPLHYLDFETFQTAIPIFEASSPWQQIPFQFSVHVKAAAGSKPRHHSWVWDGDGDPRQILLEKLEPVLSSAGSIVVYNQGFELGVLSKCCDAFPESRKWFDAVRPRFVDLLEPFRSFAAYHPDQHGSASIKSVLPAWVGKDYDGMEISDGSMASDEFTRVMFGDVPDAERRRVVAALEEYCGQDTEGMIWIVDALDRRIRK